MAEEKEYTGGSVSYYAVDVNAPINEESDPYTAECQDIIEALKLDFNEGNVLKAIWRRAAARLGRSKKGYDDGLYDAEKIVFYGQRLVAIEQRAKTPAAKQAAAKMAGLDLADVEAKVLAQTDPYGPRDAEGWYTWNGDETMRPAGRVDVRYRDTSTAWNMAADTFGWKHEITDSENDIVKWRPAQ
jgi:hypothetical protein